MGPQHQVAPARRGECDECFKNNSYTYKQPFAAYVITRQAAEMLLQVLADEVLGM